MKIERFKGIAEYLAPRVPVEVDAARAKKWSQRVIDPLPLLPFGGSIAADSAALDAWIERQMGARRRRRANPAKKAQPAPRAKRANKA